MKLNIRPIYDDKLTCNENLMITVLSWLNRNIELSFAEAWNFFFKTEEHPSLPGDSSKLSDRILTNHDEMERCFERYHGIQVCWQENSSTKILEVVKSNLQTGYPVLVMLDAYWCPWMTNTYQKHHSWHATLVVGVEEEAENLFCVDSMPLMVDGVLPPDHFLCGVTACATFSYLHEAVSTVDYHEVLHTALVQLIGAHRPTTAFEEMRLFAEEIVKSLDLGEETKEHEEVLWQAPLFNKILYVSNGRRKFAQVLGYLGREYGITPLLAAESEMLRLGMQWSSIRGLLVKAYYTPDASILVKRISSKIKALADEEENFAQSLFELCSPDTPLDSCALTDHLSSTDNTNIGELTFIDLAEYGNNKGVGEAASMECTADLTNTGAWLVYDEQLGKREWTVGEMRFIFPDVINNKYDNIACSNQQIKIPAGHYTSIMILGCGEWGNHADKMTVFYADGSVVEVPLEFSDWFFEPVFGETIAWLGRGAERFNDRVEYAMVHVRLFVQKYNLTSPGEIVAIQLPDMPTIHIFAITLQKII